MTVLLEYIGSKFIRFDVVDLIVTIILSNRTVTDLVTVDLIVILFTVFIKVHNIIALSCSSAYTLVVMEYSMLPHTDHF